MCFLFSVFRGEEECGAFPSVPHGKLKQSLHDRGTAEVECDPGFISSQRFITCIRGTWEKPVCEGELLKLLLHVESIYLF